VGKGLWAEDWGAGGVLASYSPGRGVSEAGCLHPEVDACLGFADPADLQTLHVSCAHDLRLMLSRPVLSILIYMLSIQAYFITE